MVAQHDLIQYGYSIDNQDCIVEIDDHWDLFACENGGAHLVRERVLGTSIWDYLTGADSKHLYREMFSKLRTKRTDIEIPFRCDGPDVRRYMVLHMSAHHSGSIRFLSRLLRSEPRDHVAVLNAPVTSESAFLEMCSFCKRVLVGNSTWLEVEEAITELRLFESDELPKLTHGVCPDCQGEFMQRLGHTHK